MAVRRRLLIALVLASSALPLAPNVSLADGPHQIVTSVVSATAPGPSAGLSFASASTGPCAPSDRLIGGGMRAAGTTSNALHLNASVPSDGRASSWRGIAATGDQAISGASTTAFAMCLSNGPHRIRVVASEITGPAQPNS